MRAGIPEFREELKSGKKVAMGCAINTSSGLCAEMVSSLGKSLSLKIRLRPEYIERARARMRCWGGWWRMRLRECYAARALAPVLHSLL